MRGLPIAQDERGSVASFFSAVQHRLTALLLGCRSSSASALRIPSISNPPSDIMTSASPNHAENQARLSAPYVPEHAAETFVKTATSREMRKQNEIFHSSAALLIMGFIGRVFGSLVPHTFPHRLAPYLAPTNRERGPTTYRNGG
ncbi:hypothetical protein F5Y12DRAFT_714578 [Xylaria sp. FL1777]|nr:hypothetical protein F5Y12DRAFT_714578 [Xylaria sp. FL1777]